MRSVLILAGLFCAGCANAAPITLSYSGTISQAFYADCQAYDAGGGCTAWDDHDISSTDFLYGQQVRVGDFFAGSFTYDPQTALSGMSADGHSAVYLGGVLGSQLIAGALRLPASLPRSDNGAVLIEDNGLHGYDSFYLSDWLSDAKFFASVTLDLMDSSGSIFDSFAMPTHAALADFTAPYFEVGLLRRSDGDQVHLYGDISHLTTLVTVPEPGNLSLFFVGLLGIGLALRSKRALRYIGTESEKRGRLQSAASVEPGPLDLYHCRDAAERSLSCRARKVCAAARLLAATVPLQHTQCIVCEPVDIETRMQGIEATPHDDDFLGRHDDRVLAAAALHGERP